MQLLDTRRDNHSSDILRIIEQTLQYARNRQYAGWDYADGLSSFPARVAPINNKWYNILIQESIKRFPVNIRPFLLVEQKRNYKGAALFAMANLKMSQFVSVDDYKPVVRSTEYKKEGLELAQWLVDNQSQKYRGYCGGHPHPTQDLDRWKPPDEPSIVPTCYGVQALLDASTIDKKYAETACQASCFMDKELDYTEIPEGAVIKYHPHTSTDHYTLNAVALAARTYIDLYDYTDNEEFLDRATKLLDYVTSKQTISGGWMYRDPPTASHLSMDNYHNGFIIESLFRFRQVTGNNRYKHSIREALEFYRSELFDPNGAPRWDESNIYPRSTHSAAQGIIVFAEAGSLDFARKIIEWTMNNLYDKNGRFFYRKQRFYTKRFTLMRCCQAWMAYSLCFYLSKLEGPEKESPVYENSLVNTTNANPPSVSRGRRE